MRFGVIIYLHPLYKTARDYVVRKESNIRNVVFWFKNQKEKKESSKR